MFVFDTNVLLYAADETSEFHRPCRSLLEASRSGPTPWFVTWGIAYEFLVGVLHVWASTSFRTTTFYTALLDAATSGGRADRREPRTA